MVRSKAQISNYKSSKNIRIWETRVHLYTRTYVFDKLVGRHSRHYEEVSYYDPQVLGPTGAECRPQLLHFLRMLVAKLRFGEREREDIKGNVSLIWRDSAVFLIQTEAEKHAHAKQWGSSSIGNDARESSC